MTYESFFTEREPAPPAAHRRSDAAWAQVREDYLAGASAPQLAERYGVSLSALRRRAREQGWRRSDAPDLPPGEDEDDEAALAEAAAFPPAELRALAWARAALAIRRGRLAEAQGWTRLVRQLDRLAEVDAASPTRQARAAERLAQAQAALASVRCVLPTPPAHAAGRAPSVEAPSVGLAAATSPAAAPQGRTEVHEVHEVHDLSILPCAAGAGEGDQAQPGGGGRSGLDVGGDLAPSVGLTAATSPAAAPQGRNEVHEVHGVAEAPPAPPPPPRQFGPAVPPVPPEWVRWRLHAR